MTLSYGLVASGSKGNCFYVGDNEHSFIVDAGVSVSLLRAFMKQLGRKSIDSVLITHDHIDHTRGLSAIKKRWLCQELDDDCDCVFGDKKITKFPIPHDIPCYGYKIETKSCIITILSDCGYTTKTMFDNCIDSNVLVIESNYCEKLLRSNSKYPEFVKSRVEGFSGHLSNLQALSFVAEIAKRGTLRHVILTHLSDENNNSEIVENLYKKHYAGSLPFALSVMPIGRIFNYKVAYEECGIRQ